MKIWVQYENHAQYYDTNGRYCIEFCNDSKNKPNWWYVGVRSPLESNHMNDDEKARFNIIEERLRQECSGKINSYRWNPGYKYVNSDKRDWEPNLEKLLEETKQRKGEF